MKEQKPVNINVESQVNSKDLTPGVMFAYDDQFTVMPDEAARELGLWLIEAQVIARWECNLMKLLMSKGMKLEGAARMLKELRDMSK